MDNGTSFRSFRYAKALRMLNIKHKRTRPYTPKTNGKAERFVQTSLREWAYVTAYDHSDQRRDAHAPFLQHYNTHRPHFGLNGKTPIPRIPSNNLSRHDSYTAQEQSEWELRRWDGSFDISTTS